MTAQIGMNFNSMMENMQLQKQENKDVFGTEEPQNFVSGRTAEGDILVMRAHQAAKKAMTVSGAVIGRTPPSHVSVLTSETRSPNAAFLSLQRKKRSYPCKQE